MNPSSSLGIFGGLPADLLSGICAHLQISDVINVSKLDSHLGRLVNTRIYKEIKALRVEILENHSTIQFFFKDGRRTQLNLDQVDWEDVVKNGKCIETVELEISPEKSSSQLFHVFKRSYLPIKNLKIKVLEGSDKNSHRVRTLHKRCIDLVTQHRSKLHHLEASTSDEQRVTVDLGSSMKLTYEQAVEPKPSEQMKQATNHQFVYSMFHELLEKRPSPNVTLEIGNKFDANLALQKAFQIAIPHSNRKTLESLTIEFGNSLKAVTEEEMKKVLLRHVDEFHFTTPNLQHFHCSLPHDEIDLDQEFLSLLNEPVRKSRKSPTSRPYNSSISLRVVKCK